MTYGSCIDVHTHLQSLNADVLDSYWGHVSGVIVNGTSPKDWNSVAYLARIHPSKVQACYGVHPWYVDVLERGWLQELQLRLQQDESAGVGEVGLDKSRRAGKLSVQKSVLEQQLALACTLERPISIHCVRAWGGLLDSLKSFDELPPFLLHGYLGPIEMLDAFMELGAYFSLSPRHFDQSVPNKWEVFRKIPKERVFVETDAPEGLGHSVTWSEYQKGFSDTIQHPMNIIRMYELLEQVWEASQTDVYSQVFRNFQKFNKKRFSLQE